MTGQVVEDLAKVIKNNSGLEKLYLSNNDLKTSAVVILQALKDISTLKILDLGGNSMTGQVAEDLANVIRNSLGTEELYLYNNYLKGSTIVILQALKENLTLKLLCLNNNNMTRQVVEDLANVIKNNLGLEKLYLSNNDLKACVVVILKALRENSALKILDLGYNSMSGQVAEDLTNVIRNNSGLKELYLSNNELKAFVVLILQALSKNSKLKILNLSGNNMTGQVVEDLTNFIKNNSDLEALYLSYNNLKASAVLILQALSKILNLKF